ncbi:MAG TPA: hypothetical protein VFF32_02435 [Dermatophilaceae bacterium]|nr:hypothetical protein [Dermatophilaceae bacterium]
MAFMANDVPAASKDEGRDSAGVGDAATDLGSAAGVLALAQKLHEEYVAEGQDTRQRLITEGQSRHDQIIGEATARQEELLSAGQAEHDTLIVEAKQKRAEVLQERSLLQKEIEEMRAFERDHHARQKSYLEGRLIELRQTGTDETG